VIMINEKFRERVPAWQVKGIVNYKKYFNKL
jgi:hypothetical protein